MDNLRCHVEDPISLNGATTFMGSIVMSIIGTRDVTGVNLSIL